jgi:hypothetical protein
MPCWTGSVKLATNPEDQLENNNMSTVTMGRIGADIFVALDDIKIAKRGKDGTPQADSWVVLEPGFMVSDSADLTKLVIEFGGKVLSLPYGEGVWKGRRPDRS